MMNNYSVKAVDIASPGLIKPAPLIAHVIYRLDIGGLENGLVNLINSIPANHYRHVVISLTEYTDYRHRIRNPDVDIIALHMRAGHDFSIYKKLWRLFRSIKPDIVHTRNLPTLEAAVVSAFAGVKARVHGEHGRDVYDMDGANYKYQVLRKLCQFSIGRYIALSQDLECWLQRDIKIPSYKIRQIYNGVDTNHFFPANGENKGKIMPPGFAPEGSFVIGTIGRMQAIKDQKTLVYAFLEMLKKAEWSSKNLRLVMVGDGPLRAQLQQMIDDAGATEFVWFTGSQTDVHEYYRALDLFILPSLREGISNTILEAMASGLPVIATDVGGNPELVLENETGYLVHESAPNEIEEAVRKYYAEPEKLHQHGMAGRKRVEERFSLDNMVNKYITVYDELMTTC